MPRFLKSLLISLAVHLVLIAGIAVVFKPSPFHKIIRPLHLNLQKREAVRQPQAAQPSPERGQIEKRQQDEKVPLPVPEAQDNLAEPEQPSALEALRQQTQLQRQGLIARRPALPRDSLLRERSQEWQQEIQSLPLGKPVDEIAESIKQQNGETAISKMTVTELPKPKAVKPQFNFIPSEDQARAMAYLFEHGEGTQVDIYPSMNTDDPVTARKFDDSMAHLAKKGFVKREKVSPENLIVVGTPIGGVGIETSPKNRRNPVYSYTLNVERRRVLAFLDSQLLNAKEKLQAAKGDTTGLSGRIRRIQSRLNILRKTPAQ